MAVTLDYQLELNGLLMGPDTPYQTAPEGWGGFGVPAPKTYDVDLDQADGVYTGQDRVGTRVLTFPLTWGSTPADVMTGLIDLNSAWGVVQADVTLQVKLPGYGVLNMAGRPRGLVEDLSMMPKGQGSCICTFFMGNPNAFS